MIVFWSKIKGYTYGAVNVELKSWLPLYEKLLDCSEYRTDSCRTYQNLFDLHDVWNWSRIVWYMHYEWDSADQFHSHNSLKLILKPTDSESLIDQLDRALRLLPINIHISRIFNGILAVHCQGRFMTPWIINMATKSANGYKPFFWKSGCVT